MLSPDGDVAAYALFWFDPVSATGLVEPMRTEDSHQRRSWHATCWPLASNAWYGPARGASSSATGLTTWRHRPCTAGRASCPIGELGCLYAVEPEPAASTDPKCVGGTCVRVLVIQRPARCGVSREGPEGREAAEGAQAPGRHVHGAEALAAAVRGVREPATGEAKARRAKKEMVEADLRLVISIARIRSFLVED